MGGGYPYHMMAVIQQGCMKAEKYYDTLWKFHIGFIFVLFTDWEKERNVKEWNVLSHCVCREGQENKLVTI